jgi:hypothetical protein
LSGAHVKPNFSAAITIGPNLLSAASLDQAKAMRAAGAASDSVKVNLKINGKESF